MGACFQAPCAAPGQRHVMPNICLFHCHPHQHMSFHTHKTTSMLAKCAGIFVWMGCLEPLTTSPQGQEEKRGRTKVIIVTIK